MPLSLYIGLCLLPLSFILVLWWAITHKDKSSKVIAVITLCSLIILNVLACYSTLFVVLGHYGHFTHVQINDHVYYAEALWKVGVGGNSRALFVLFECDSLGVLCKRTHSEFFYIDEEEFEAMQLSLIPHPDGSKISMQIDGEIVYTRSP